MYLKDEVNKQIKKSLIVPKKLDVSKERKSIKYRNRLHKIQQSNSVQ